jgi:hypothetical protein
MIDRLPRRLRLGFSKTPPDIVTTSDEAVGDQVDFVAYGEDCILSGRAVLDADRLTDMLNAHDEYLVSGLTVERFDEDTPFELDDEIAVPRDEIVLVHATGPRGDAGRRHRTMPQHLALKMGLYEVRGFLHSLPGADPVEAMRRRKTMVPLTNARIEYTMHGERRAVTVDTVIVNREQIDWVEALLPSEVEFPEGPGRLVSKPV